MVLKLSRIALVLMMIVGVLWGVANVTNNLVHADEVVILPDPNLEVAIREAIDKPIGDIYQSDLEELTEFSASERNIVNLSGLEHCTNMTSLDLGYNQISDISPSLTSPA